MIRDMLARIGIPAELQRANRTNSSYAGTQLVWEKLADVRIAIKLLNGNEVLEHSKRGIEATHRVYMIENAQRGDRLIIDGKYHYIKYVDNVMLQERFNQVLTWCDDND